MSTEGHYPLGSDASELERLDPNGVALLAGIVRTLLPLLERTGVANAAEIGVETLHQRMSQELADANAVFVFPTLATAWATKTM